MREVVELVGGAAVEGALALDTERAREAALAERKRLQHVRAVVLGRRGEADRRRRRLLESRAAAAGDKG